MTFHRLSILLAVLLLAAPSAALRPIDPIDNLPPGPGGGFDPDPGPDFDPIPDLEPLPPDLDPCLFSPRLCDPFELPPIPVPEPEAQLDPDLTFAGTEKVRVAGFGKRADIAALDVELVDPGAFAAEDDEGVSYTGTLVPIGRTGRKFQLELDAASQARLAAKIARVADGLSGAAPSVTFTKTPRVLVKLSRSGDEARLRIRARAVVDATATAVRYQARLFGVPVPEPA